MYTPELLAPAGSLEKLKIAVLYGADAVYCGGTHFGLRAASENFTLTEMRQGVAFAHARGAKVYVALNAFLRTRDIGPLGDYARELENIGVDAVIVSDAGAMHTIARHSRIPLHLSTQASCLNAGSARMWKEMGAVRLVLGREASLQDAQEIKAQVGVEIEMFVHGSMCMPAYAQAGIDSIKIEGRNKGPMYAAQSTRAYAQALGLLKEGAWTPEQLERLEADLRLISHRDYTQASLLSPAHGDSVYDKREGEEKTAEVAAVVRQVDERELLLEVRSAFATQDLLELVPFQGPAVRLDLSSLQRAVDGSSVERTRPGLLVRVPRPLGADAQAWNLVRRPLEARP